MEIGSSKIYVKKMSRREMTADILVKAMSGEIVLIAHASAAVRLNNDWKYKRLADRWYIKWKAKYAVKQMRNVTEREWWDVIWGAFIVSNIKIMILEYIKGWW